MVFGTFGWSGMVDGRGRSPWTFSLYHAAFAYATTAIAAAMGETAVGASSPSLAALDPCRVTSLSRGTDPGVDSCCAVAVGHELAVAAPPAVATPPLAVLRGEASSERRGTSTACMKK
jgi:hypothetical protein